MTKDLRGARNFTNRLAGKENSPPMYFDDDQFDDADAESSLTRPVKTSALRMNGYVMIQGNPCKIVSMSTSRPGKHGHAKVHLVGVDIFTRKKYEDISPSTHTMEVPVSNRKDYIVVDMGRTGYLSLMDDAGYTRADLRVDDDVIRTKLAEKLGKQDDEDIVVTVLKVLDKELVMSVKTGIK